MRYNTPTADRVSYPGRRRRMEAPVKKWYGRRCLGVVVRAKINIDDPRAGVYTTLN